MTRLTSKQQAMLDAYALGPQAFAVVWEKLRPDREDIEAMVIKTGRDAGLTDQEIIEKWEWCMENGDGALTIN